MTLLIFSSNNSKNNFVNSAPSNQQRRWHLENKSNLFLLVRIVSWRQLVVQSRNWGPKLWSAMKNLQKSSLRNWFHTKTTPRLLQPNIRSQLKIVKTSNSRYNNWQLKLLKNTRKSKKMLKRNMINFLLNQHNKILSQYLRMSANSIRKRNFSKFWLIYYLMPLNSPRNMAV